MGRSLGDPKQNSLGGSIITQDVTLTATAASAVSLLTLPSGYNASDILELWVPAKDSSGNARGAILYGGATSQLGYLASDVETRFPVRGGNVYFKRGGGVDVTMTLVAVLD